MKNIIAAKIQMACNGMFHHILSPLTFGIGIQIVALKITHLITKRNTWDQSAQFWANIYEKSLKFFAINFMLILVQIGINWQGLIPSIANTLGPIIFLFGFNILFIAPNLRKLLKSINHKKSAFGSILMIISNIGSILLVTIFSTWFMNTYNLDYVRMSAHNPATQISHIINIVTLPQIENIMCNKLMLMHFLKDLGVALLISSCYMITVASYYTLKNKYLIFALTSFKLASISLILGISMIAANKEYFSHTDFKIHDNTSKYTTDKFIQQQTQSMARKIESGLEALKTLEKIDSQANKDFENDNQYKSNAKNIPFALMLQQDNQLAQLPFIFISNEQIFNIALLNVPDFGKLHQLTNILKYILAFLMILILLFLQQFFRKKLKKSRMLLKFLLLTFPLSILGYTFYFAIKHLAQKSWAIYHILPIHTAVNYLASDLIIIFLIINIVSVLSLIISYMNTINKIIKIGTNISIQKVTNNYAKTRVKVRRILNKLKIKRIKK